jgi:Fe-S cluster biosynthesis and repair protein YggX
VLSKEGNDVSQVECSRCGNTAEALPRAPLGGPLGELVLSQTCAACWKAWLDAQVILINENQLSGANPEHVDRLMDQMRVFLSLREAG